VAINPTILDERGRRMSKSAGNGVDPVDIIETHGADALRFTLTTLATETQDARMPVRLICPHCQEHVPNPESKQEVIACPKCKKPFTRPIATATGTADAPMARATSEKFDLGRNFCNKLWNAARFALSNLESITGKATDGYPWALADKWIISRFNRAVSDANAAMSVYRFDQYAKVCYDFFWRDFCDWYVEAIKPALKDAARAAQTSDVLAVVLDGALRLMHPMIPFITETIWWRLNSVRPARGTTRPSNRLILATWPTGGAVDDAAEADFSKLQEIIAAIRNVRNEHKADPKKSVEVTIDPGDSRSLLEQERGTIELLATCRVTLGSATPTPGSARATAGGCEISIAGLTDTEAEQQRQAKQRQTLIDKREALRKRLANPAYTEKAPPHLVQQTRDELAAVEAELTKLDRPTN
jgi:valyl-tRNA synthetase